MAAPEAMTATPPPPLLEVRGLKKHFPLHRGVLGRVAGHVHAVDGIEIGRAHV
jgi:ABC-type microcin C transport system duplicated ATPase subunit YejF